VNQALEDKLRDRTTEFNNASQRIGDLERRINHEQSLVQEKGKRIRVLENELARCARMQDDLLSREREYGKRILQLKVEEFMGLCRDHQRKKRLESAINGNSSSGVEDEVPTEQDLQNLATDTLGMLKNQFEEFFEERQLSIQEVSRQAEASVERERKGIEETHQEVLEAHRARSRTSARSGSVCSPLQRSVGVQAELGSPHGARKTGLQAEMGSHLTWAGTMPEAHSGSSGERRHRARSVHAHEVGRGGRNRRHSSLILAQAEVEFSRADRHNSLILSQPLHLQRQTVGGAPQPMESVMEFLDSRRASTLTNGGDPSSGDGVEEGKNENAPETKQVQVSDKEEQVAEEESDGFSSHGDEEHEDEDHGSPNKAPEQGVPPAPWPRLQRSSAQQEAMRARRSHGSAPHSTHKEGRSITPSTRESSRPESRASSYIPSRSTTPWQGGGATTTPEQTFREDSGMPQLKKAGAWTSRGSGSNRPAYKRQSTQRRTILESIR